MQALGCAFLGFTSVLSRAPSRPRLESGRGFLAATRSKTKTVPPRGTAARNTHLVCSLTNRVFLLSPVRWGWWSARRGRLPPFFWACPDPLFPGRPLPLAVGRASSLVCVLAGRGAGHCCIALRMITTQNKKGPHMASHSMQEAMSYAGGYYRLWSLIAIAL